MSKEYRKSKRVKPRVEINIVDVIIGSNLGEVLNLSTDGLLASCNFKIEKGELFQTQWSFNAIGMQSISVGLECLWSESQYTNFCLCGFHIIDISQEGQHILVRLIAQSDEVD